MRSQAEVNGWGVTPQLVIPLENWHRLMAYARLCPAEINGFGLIEQSGSLLVMTEVFITNQHVTGGSADVDAADIHELLYRMTRAGLDTGKLRVQWHSHVDMPAYFSTTDTRNIEGYDSEWMVSLVFNRRGELDCRLDVFRPFRFGAKIPVRIGAPSVTDNIVEEVRGDIAEHVTVAGTLGFKRRLRPEAPELVSGGAIPHGSLLVVEGDSGS